MSENYFVGIDQSYTGFGLTIMGEDESHQSLRRAFPAAKFGDGAARLKAIQEWLTTALPFGHTILGVCMEGYSHGSKFGREQAGELGGAVKLALLALGHTPTIVPPTSVKKFATGKGVAKKNEMLLQVYKRWGVEFTDDNEADSYVLARIAKACLEEHFSDLPKFQQEVLTAIK